MSRLRMSHPKHGTPPNVYDDYDWIRRNERQLREQYGEGFIVVYQRQVIGVGETYDSAITDAEQRLPADVEEITPVVDTLEKRHPFFRLTPKVLQE